MALADHLDKLKAFNTVVESRTLREAARKLHVTQPSLTKMIQTLEDAAGVQLLTRSRNGISPTEAGKRVSLYASSVLKNLEDLEQILLHPVDQLAGHLRIGAYASLAEYLWPDFVPEFKKQAPGLRLSIYTSEVVSQQFALESGQIDVLVDAEPRLSGDLISWKLYDDQFNFYAKPTVVTKAKNQDVQTLPLIYSPQAFDHGNKKILQHLEEAGYAFQERIELDSFMAVLAFAKKGLGIGVLPNRLALATKQSKQLQVMPMKGFSIKGFGVHTFTATIRENHKDDPRIRLFVRALRDWFKD